jgi:Domain of unknown function (DUF4190)
VLGACVADSEAVSGSTWAARQTFRRTTSALRLARPHRPRPCRSHGKRLDYCRDSRHAWFVSTAWPLQQRTDGRAIASFALGVLGFVVFPVLPSVLAIWLGISAKRRMRSDPGLTGEGLATAGIILGIVELVLVALAIAALAFFFFPAHVSNSPGHVITTHP